MKPQRVDGYDREDIDDRDVMDRVDPKVFSTFRELPFGTMGAGGLNSYRGPVGYSPATSVEPYFNNMFAGTSENERLGDTVLNGRFRFSIIIKRRQHTLVVGDPAEFQPLRVKLLLIQDKQPLSNFLPLASWFPKFQLLTGAFAGADAAAVNELAIPAKQSARILWDTFVCLPVDTFWRATYNYQEVQETSGTPTAVPWTAATVVKEEVLGEIRSRDSEYVITDEIDVPEHTQFPAAPVNAAPIWNGLWFLVIADGVQHQDAEIRVWGNFYFSDN